MRVSEKWCLYPLMARETRSDRALGWVVVALLVAASSGYLWHFVDRGWIPHDEGTIALDATSLLQGDLPHVDFEDPYTGGMTYLYAGAFKVTGVDLVHLRWLLFAAALACVVSWFLLLRRMLPLAGAALVAFVALLWSFPNYFAGLPSWWCLTCASATLVCMFQYLERRRWTWLFAAGLLLGLACAFKQTGVYLVSAALFGLTYDEQLGRPRRSAPRKKWTAFVFRVALSLTSFGGLWFISQDGLDGGFVVRLILPIAALAAVMLADEWERDEITAADTAHLVGRLAMLVGCAALPLALLLLNYWPAHLGEWVHGALVLPQERGVSAAKPFPAMWLSLPALLPIISIVDRRAISRSAASFLSWLALPLAVAYAWIPAYQLFWNSVQMLGSLTPALAAAVLWRQRDNGRLFLLAAMTAFLALYQFPFAAPVYFCYVAPLALLTMIGVMTVIRARPVTYVPSLVALALFALLSTNRGYAWNIGLGHGVADYSVPLNLPRASLHVNREDARVYRRVTALVAEHGFGGIHAFPDCPEIYFLTGARNPTGANFDFFSPRRDADIVNMWTRLGTSVIVVNHAPLFSPPASDAVVSKARDRYPNGEDVGKFEVRWTAERSE
jgi:hypothetical protein